MELTTEDHESELRRSRDILMAAIDYLLERTADRAMADQSDPGDLYFHQLKQKVEDQYGKGNQDRLQKWLQELMDIPRQSGDLAFAGYIREKTGHEIDIFANIREEAEKIMGRKRIGNKDEAVVIRALLNISRQTDTDKEKLDMLTGLLADYDHRRNRRKTQSKGYFFVNCLSISWSPDQKRKLTVFESGTGIKDAVTLVDLHVEKTGASIYGVNGTNLGIKAYWKDNGTIVIATRKEYTEITRKVSELQSFQDLLKVEYVES